MALKQAPNGTSQRRLLPTSQETGEHLRKGLQNHLNQDAVCAVSRHDILDPKEEHKAWIEADKDEGDVEANSCKEDHRKAYDGTRESLPLELL
jgi:hypothetical protein